MLHIRNCQEYVWGGRRLKQDADDSCGKKTGAVDSRKAEQNFNATLELLREFANRSRNSKGRPSGELNNAYEECARDRPCDRTTTCRKR